MIHEVIAFSKSEACDLMSDAPAPFEASIVQRCLQMTGRHRYYFVKRRRAVGANAAAGRRLRFTAR